MTLPMLGGLDQATSNLPQLGQNIASIINPHWQFQQKLQQEMLANPDLVQQLAEVERNAPGTLMKLGAGPKLTQILQNTPMSKERQQKQDITQYQLDRAKTENDITQATKDDVIASHRLERERLESALQDIREQTEADNTVKGLDVNDIARRYARGEKVNPADLQTIMKSKSHPLFIDALGFERQKISLEHSEQMQDRLFRQQEAMLQARQDKQQLDENKRAAIRSYQQTKVGTPEAWLSYYNSPDLQLRAQQLADNPSEVKTDADRQLMAIGNKLKFDDQASHMVRVNAATAELRKNRLATKAKGIKPEDVAAFAQAMTPALDVLRQENYADLSPIVDGKNIFFMDNRTGLKLTDDSSIPETASLPYTRQEIDAAVNEFSKMGIFERKKWLTKNKDTKLSEIVKQRYNQQGFHLTGGY